MAGKEIRNSLHEFATSSPIFSVSLSFPRLSFYSCLITYCSLEIWSIRSSSSFANVVCPTIPILLNICSGLDAPISTLVTSLSFNSQESAICGRLCPLSFARASSFLIFSIFSGVMSDAWRNLPSLATRLSAGIPLMYFLITFPVPED